MKSTKLKVTINAAVSSLLLCSLILNCWGIWWGLPSYHGWAIDEIIPQQVLSGIDANFSHGWHYKYPPFHYYLLTVTYLPILLFDWLNLVDINSLPTYTLLFYLQRFVSVFMGIGIIFLVYLCGKEIYEARTSFLAALMTALICPFVYFSKTTNLEIPYVFWFVLSLLFYLRILKYQKLRDYLLFSGAAVISICTKDQAYGFYVLTPLFIIIIHHVSQKQKQKNVQLWQSLIDKKIIFSLLLSVGLFFLLHNILFNWSGFIAHVKLLTEQAGDAPKTFKGGISENLKLLGQTLKLTSFSFGRPMFVVCLVGLINSLVRKKKNYLLLSTLVPILSYYLFYISYIAYVRDRFTLPVCIVLTFFGAHLLKKLLRPNYKYFKFMAFAVSILFAYTLAYSSSVNILMSQDSRYYVEKWLSKNISDSDLILSIGQQEYLPRLEIYDEVMNTRSPSLSNDYLLEVNPDYIITTSSFDIRRSKPGTTRYDFFNSLKEEKYGYKLVLKYQSQPTWNLLKPDKKLTYHDTNLDKINPEIRVYSKEKVEN